MDKVHLLCNNSPSLLNILPMYCVICSHFPPTQQVCQGSTVEVGTEAQRDPWHPTGNLQVKQTHPPIAFSSQLPLSWFTEGPSSRGGTTWPQSAVPGSSVQVGGLRHEIPGRLRGQEALCLQLLNPQRSFWSSKCLSSPFFSWCPE